MSLEGQRVLLVEDEALIALDIEDMICASKGEVACSANTLAQAMRLADTPDSLAVLDFHLGGDSSLPVAAKLDACGIPFLFYTGYNPKEISEAWPNALIVSKSSGTPRLISALETLASQAGQKVALLHRCAK